LPFSYWFDKPQFLTEGRLATVLIIPSSWGSQLGGHLPASSIFSGIVAREKEDFFKGSLAHTSFTLFLFCFILFLLASFYQKYKKLVPTIVVIFVGLLSFFIMLSINGWFL
jgi:hypothetical protein